MTRITQERFISIYILDSCNKQEQARRVWRSLTYFCYFFINIYTSIQDPTQISLVCEHLPFPLMQAGSFPLHFSMYESLYSYIYFMTLRHVSDTSTFLKIGILFLSALNLQPPAQGQHSRKAYWWNKVKKYLTEVLLRILSDDHCHS